MDRKFVVVVIILKKCARNYRMVVSLYQKTYCGILWSFPAFSFPYRTGWSATLHHRVRVVIHFVYILFSSVSAQPIATDCDGILEYRVLHFFRLRARLGLLRFFHSIFNQQKHHDLFRGFCSTVLIVLNLLVCATIFYKS